MADKMSLLEKIAEARVRLGQAELDKTGYNPHAGFKYFQLDDFMPEARKICRELRFLPIESFEAGRAVMTVRDFDDPSAIVQFECPAEKPNIPGTNATQVIGGMITYLRRYLWMMLFEITENDEFDAEQGKDEPAKPQTARKSTKPASQAAPKDERPAEKPEVEPISRGTFAWKSVLTHFGYDFRKPKTDSDNTDAFHASLEFVKPYGIKDAKEMKELSDDTAEAIISRIANMGSSEGGPESFKGDDL